MKDTYAFVALSAVCVYILRLRKRQQDIKENLISISNNMRVHQEERAYINQQNTIATITLPSSNPPSPILDATVLNTPTPRPKGEDVHELTLEDTQAQQVCVSSVYAFTIFSVIVYVYCIAFHSNICYSDLFGPEL